MPRGIYPRQSMKDRFWSKVDKSDGHGPNGDCWVWTSETIKQGYGRFWMKGGPILAHRASILLSEGKMPDQDVLHKCDNPKCVRPDHLFLGSHSDNMKDMIEKERQRRGDSSPVAVVNSQQVQEIRSSKETNAYLAKVYGIDSSQISRIRNHKSWSHV